MASTVFKIVENYKGFDICIVNFNKSIDAYYSVQIDGQLSILALVSRIAAKNVIDTHIRSQHN